MLTQLRVEVVSNHQNLRFETEELRVFQQPASPTSLLAHQRELTQSQLVWPRRPRGRRQRRPVAEVSFLRSVLVYRPNTQSLGEIRGDYLQWRRVDHHRTAHRDRSHKQA